jgi:hypothetical protein
MEQQELNFIYDETNDKTNKDLWIETLSTNDDLLILTLGFVLQAYSNGFFTEIKKENTYKTELELARSALYEPVNKEEQELLHNIIEEIKRTAE